MRRFGLDLGGFRPTGCPMGLNSGRPSRGGTRRLGSRRNCLVCASMEARRDEWERDPCDRHGGGCPLRLSTVHPWGRLDGHTARDAPDSTDDQEPRSRWAKAHWGSSPSARIVLIYRQFIVASAPGVWSGMSAGSQSRFPVSMRTHHNVRLPRAEGRPRGLPEWTRQ